MILSPCWKLRSSGFEESYACSASRNLSVCPSVCGASPLCCRNTRESSFKRARSAPPWVRRRSHHQGEEQLSPGQSSPTSARRHHSVRQRLLVPRHTASMSVWPSITLSAVSSELKLKETGAVSLSSQDLLVLVLGCPTAGPGAPGSQVSYLRTRSSWSWSWGVLPEDDGLGGNRQLLADLLRQRLVGGPVWDHDGEGEAEPDFDDAGVVGELEFKVRGQRRCTFTCRFDEAAEQVSPSAARLCRPHGESDLGHLREVSLTSAGQWTKSSSGQTYPSSSRAWSGAVETEVWISPVPRSRRQKLQLLESAEPQTSLKQASSCSRPSAEQPARSPAAPGSCREPVPSGNNHRTTSPQPHPPLKGTLSPQSRIRIKLCSHALVEDHGGPVVGPPLQHKHHVSRHHSQLVAGLGDKLVQDDVRFSVQSSVETVTVVTLRFPNRTEISSASTSEPRAQLWLESGHFQPAGAKRAECVCV